MSRSEPHETRGSGDLPVEPFQRAFELSGLSAYELARRLGYLRNHRHKGVVPDSTAALRLLGLRPHPGKGGAKTKRTVSFATAERLVEVFQVDPVDVGL